MSSLRRQTRTLLSVFVSTLLMAGMLALPAQANNGGGVLVFSGGNAVIGLEEIDDKDKNTCSKEDDDGLNFPVTNEPKLLAAQKKRCYNFQAGDDKPGECRADFGGTQDTCNIVAHGNVHGWCGSSIGWNGWGEVDLASTDGVDLHLKNISWHLSAGGTLVIDGDVAKSNTGGTWTDSGDFLGIVQARGTDNTTGDPLPVACLRPNGADSFQVDGVAVVFGQII